VGEEASHENGLLFGDFSPPGVFPKGVSALHYEKVGRNQTVRPKLVRVLCSFLWKQPFWSRRWRRRCSGASCCVQPPHQPCARSSLVTALADQILRRGEVAASEEGAKLGGEFVEIAFGFCGEDLTQYVADFGFGRLFMANGAALEAGDEFIVEIANADAGHTSAKLSMMTTRAYGVGRGQVSQ
jgi:hypothetical protein